MKSEMGILMEAVMHEHMIACTCKRERTNELKQKTSTFKRKQCDCFIQFFIWLEPKQQRHLHVQHYYASILTYHQGNTRGDVFNGTSFKQI